MSKLPVLVALFLVLTPEGRTAVAQERRTPLTCTYEMRTWNVAQGRSVDVRTVRHLYSRLLPEEVDSVTGCTVCSEDQEVIAIPPLQPFSLCYRLAPMVRAALEHLIRNKAPVFTVTGYHVVKSRGPIDGAGNRTGFSNHSYGTAMDINPELNGLYDHCVEFGPRCWLIRGGEWRPGVPGTLEREGEIVATLTSIGLCWGGEIAGKQKDFMHFSPTGY